MGLETPAWLWLLLPWAALLVLTLRAYRKIRSVPFIDLWPRELVGDEKRRAWRPPPLAIVLLLLALLTGIAALSRPWLRSGHPRIQKLTLVLDRGVTMLAGRRLEQAATEFLATASPLLDPDAQITIIDPLQADTLVGPAGLADALSRPATALDLNHQVAAATRRAIQNDDVVLAIAGHPELPGAIRVRPRTAVQNVGIVGASENRGECWLTIRNDSDRQHASVSFSAGGESVSHDIELAPRGGQRAYALKCPPTRPLRISLHGEDDLQDDNNWWILPEEVPARLSVAPDAPEWLRRFAASYSNVNAPSELSPDVSITIQQAQTPRSLSVSAGDSLLAIVDQVLPDHPLLRHVTLPKQVLVGGPLPAGEWQVIWQSNGRPLLAAADATRSVWIGFRPAGEITSDYLVLLANAVNFCAGVACSESEPQALAGAWKPIEGPALATPQLPGQRAGLYRNGDRYHAINVRAPALQHPAPGAPFEQELAAAAARSSRTQLASMLWLGSAMLLACAAACIRASVRRT